MFVGFLVGGYKYSFIFPANPTKGAEKWRNVHFVWKGILPETNSLHLKIDGWKTIHSFWDCFLASALSFRKCNKNPRLENQSRGMLLLFCFGMLMFNIVFTVRAHTY